MAEMNRRRAVVLAITSPLPLTPWAPLASNRHTLVTELAESGASDQTLMDIAGHLSKQMLKHYSHIRMEAKRTALESIVQKEPATPAEPQQNHSPVPTTKQQLEGEYAQKSPQSGESGNEPSVFPAFHHRARAERPSRPHRDGDSDGRYGFRSRRSRTLLRAAIRICEGRSEHGGNGGVERAPWGRATRLMV